MLCQKTDTVSVDKLLSKKYRLKRFLCIYVVTHGEFKYEPKRTLDAYLTSKGGISEFRVVKRATVKWSRTVRVLALRLFGYWQPPDHHIVCVATQTLRGGWGGGGGS